MDNLVQANGVPAPLTSLVGRQRELDSLEALLGTARLLTLTGPGGSGKTRLAIALASRAGARFPDGTLWVDLSAVQDRDFVAKQIAAALGLHDDGGQPSLTLLCQALGSRSLLLILDNCEQVVETCAGLAEQLLHACRGLKILATSREALSVAGEVAWMAPTLSVPCNGGDVALEQIARSEAVQLFVERARDVLPSFELNEANARAVAQICRALDGIPLAIELAAARVRVLSPEQIVQRLQDVFHLLTAAPRTAASRHRTLRATIDWSYRLLTDRERLLFERLSVFPASFTLEAAEHVCADERIGAEEVLDLIATLTEKSLLYLEDHGSLVRYRLLEFIRQYAQERLHERGEELDVRGRHTAFFRGLAAEAEPHLMVLVPEWMARVAKDYENFRLALSWSFDAAGDPASGVAISKALQWYWYYTVSWTEGLKWLRKAIAATDAVPDPAARAGMLRTWGAIASCGGDPAEALSRLRESERLWREIGDRRHLAYTLSNLAHLGGACAVTAVPGGAALDLADAERLMEEAEHLARTAGQPYDVAYVLANSTAWLASWRGDHAAAEAALAEAEAIWRSCHGGVPQGLALVLNARAQVALLRGELTRAVELAREALRPRGAMPDAWFASRSLRTLGYVALQQGAAEEAVTLLRGSDALLASAGTSLSSRERPEYEEAIAELRGRIPGDSFALAWQAGSRVTLADAINYPTAATPPTPAPQEQTSPAAAPQPIAPAPAAEIPTVAGAEIRAVVVGEIRPAPGTEALATVPVSGLHVNALGPLQIYREGALVSPEAWASAKPREVLLFLLCHPQGCTKEQIGLALWPDASPAQVRNSFHNTLHRLRKTLGEGDWISYVGDRYRIEAPGGCEFDAADFERDVGAALRELRSGADAAPRLRDALALYRGAFLEHEVVGDWHLEVRDRLQRLYNDGLSALGAHYMAAEQYAAARDVYQRLLRSDELNEEAYRRMMSCLAHLGERMHALRLYQRLVVLLENELSTTPEPETTELFELLQRPQAA